MEKRRVLFYCLFISSETGKQSNNLLLRPSLASYFISHFNSIVNVALLIRHTLLPGRTFPPCSMSAWLWFSTKRRSFYSFHLLPFLPSPSRISINAAKERTAQSVSDRCSFSHSESSRCFLEIYIVNLKCARWNWFEWAESSSMSKCNLSFTGWERNGGIGGR